MPVTPHRPAVEHCLGSSLRPAPPRRRHAVLPQRPPGPCPHACPPRPTTCPLVVVGQRRPVPSGVAHGPPPRLPLRHCPRRFRPLSRQRRAAGGGRAGQQWLPVRTDPRRALGRGLPQQDMGRVPPRRRRVDAVHAPGVLGAMGPPRRWQGLGASAAGHARLAGWPLARRTVLCPPARALGLAPGGQRPATGPPPWPALGVETRPSGRGPSPRPPAAWCAAALGPGAWGASGRAAAPSAPLDHRPGSPGWGRQSRRGAVRPAAHRRSPPPSPPWRHGCQGPVRCPPKTGSPAAFVLRQKWLARGILLSVISRIPV